MMGIWSAQALLALRSEASGCLAILHRILSTCTLASSEIASFACAQKQSFWTPKYAQPSMI